MTIINNYRGGGFASVSFMADEAVSRVIGQLLANRRHQPNKEVTLQVY